jgi:hypothetical protein
MSSLSRPGELTLADPEFSDFFGDLISQDADHAGSIERFTAFFGDRNAEKQDETATKLAPISVRKCPSCS